MKKIELLSPVGNIDMAYMAIHNGADAIYLAGKSYGARKYAKNFTNEELVNIIKYAHLYGVKVYVTVNIIIYENELEDALKYIEFLHKNNVDALIMQDLGLISLVRIYYPNLEIHASTQCHNHNNSGLSLLKKLGVKRVVLDREMSLEEINSLNIDIEKEVFIYGALCVSYSGCCLFSSLNGGRSGNRGECVGCCRLPYQLIESGKIINKEEKYPLSTKELNTLNNLPKLIESGIDSLKIEGRMKSPSYVGYVTRCARNIIDAYYNNRPRKLTEEEITNLKKLYNRGFTEGYLFSEKNIINATTPNHQGIPIGKVLKIEKNKIKIKILSDTLNQEDGIRFKKSEVGMIANKIYNEKRLLVNKITKGQIGYLDLKGKIKENDDILKTIDTKLEQEIINTKEKKIEVTIKVIAKLNTPLQITISDGIFTITKKGEIIESALKEETNITSIKQQLQKLGNTPYTLKEIEVIKDNNIFIKLNNLNEIRRYLTEKLTEKRKNIIPHEVIIKKKESLLLPKEKETKEINYNIHVLARTEEQIEECLKHNVKAIYITKKELYQKYKNKVNIYLRISRVNIKEEKYKNEKLLVGDIGSTYLYSKNNKIVTDYYLNVVNHATIDLLNSIEPKRITLSVELTYEQTKELMKQVKEKKKIEIITYGRIELMIMKHKLNKTNCYIENQQHHKYPILIEDNLSHVMHYKDINKINEIKNYQKLGIENYRIELLNETKEEVNKILSMF